MRRTTTLPVRIGLIIALASLLPGCGAIPWLSSEKDPNPPTAINKKLPQQVNISTLWKTRIGKGTDARQLRLVPAVANGKLYAADPSGKIVALSPRDGRTLWERKTDFQFSGGPDVRGETLVLGTTNGELLALSTRNGAQQWRAQLGSEILSVPRIIGDLVVVHTIDDSVYGIELADGAERWRFSYPAPVLTLHGSSTPVAAGDGIIVGFAGGKLVFLEPEQGAPLWETTVTPPRGRSELDRIADIDADPVVVGDIAYVGTYNGDLAAVDVVTGSILWRRELSAHAGLSADESALYVTDSDDNLWSADPADGAGLWRQEGLAHRRLPPRHCSVTTWPSAIWRAMSTSFHAATDACSASSASPRTASVINPWSMAASRMSTRTTAPLPPCAPERPRCPPPAPRSAAPAQRPRSKRRVVMPRRERMLN